MRAFTVIPGVAGSASLEDVPEPVPDAGEILVQAQRVGICGTDREILAGTFGTAPPGEQRLILGHESLGRVLSSGDPGFRAGDWVCGIVRRPDPVPCAHCARGEWDLCENDRYTEHGVKALHGFAVERYVLEPRFAVRIDPALAERGVLMEPASIVAKAWARVEDMSRDEKAQPRRVLVIGAGPIGLLATLMGVQRGLEMHVLDRVTDGPKPQLVRDLGAIYHTGEVAAVGAMDIVLECTGVATLVFAAIQVARPNGIVCLAGISSGSHTISFDAGSLERELVVENTVVFGTVSANRSHFERGAEALRRADPAWLDRMITRQIPLERWAEAVELRAHDVKTVLTFP